MAGKIVADTLEHSTAGSVTTDYVVNGSAKAWMNFDGGTSTAAITDSFNTSSIDDNGGGDYGSNFTSSFANATYVKSGLAEESTSGNSEDLHVGVGDKTASGDQFTTSDASDGTSARDAERCDVMYVGEVA